MAMRNWGYVAAILTVYAYFSPLEANAGVVLATWGDTISHVGEIAPEYRNVQAQLKHFEAVESKAQSAFKTAATKAELTDAALADLLEREVLPEWRTAHQRLSDLKPVSPSLQRDITSLLEYMRLRQEGWEILVGALRQGDEQKEHQAAEKLKLADAAAPTIHIDPGAHQVGFKWSYWGVFWIDLWTHSGTYCTYEGKKYKPIQPDEAARLLGISENELSKPFLYQVPLGWLILGPLIALGIFSSIMEKRKPNPIAQLFEDARYQKALEIFSAEYAKPLPATQPTPGLEVQPAPDDESRFRAALEAAVQHLSSLGVARDEAERNLVTMMHVLSQAQQQETAAPAGSEPA